MLRIMKYINLNISIQIETVLNIILLRMQNLYTK